MLYHIFIIISYRLLRLFNMISEPTWAFISIAIDCLECIPWAVRGLLRSVICQCRTTPIPCCVTPAAGLRAWSKFMPATPNTLNLKGVKIKDKDCSIMILSYSAIFLYPILDEGHTWTVGYSTLNVLSTPSNIAVSSSVLRSRIVTVPYSGPKTFTTCVTALSPCLPLSKISIYWSIYHKTKKLIDSYFAMCS